MALAGGEIRVALATAPKAGAADEAAAQAQYPEAREVDLSPDRYVPPAEKSGPASTQRPELWQKRLETAGKVAGYTLIAATAATILGLIIYGVATSEGSGGGGYPH